MEYLALKYEILNRLV